MALVRPEPTSLVSVEQFRQSLGYNPYHFWQQSNATVPVTSSCNEVVYQYGWQNADAVGREEIERALMTAEEKLRDYLGYDIAPKYRESTVAWPQFYDHSYWRYGMSDRDDRWISVTLPYGQVQAIGIESLTLVGTAAVAYSDSNSDGIDDTFTVSIATTETDPTKLGVYFIAADRLNDEDVGEKWRIRPVSVQITGGTATIKGASWLLIKPILCTGVAVQPLDPDASSNFVTSLAVYIRTTDPNGTTDSTSQAKFVWETLPFPMWAQCCNCGSTPTDPSTDPAATASAVGRAGIRDSENGIVYLGTATYNTTTQVWASQFWGNCSPPAKITIRYLAGLPLESDGQISRQWQKIVSYLAAAELPIKICGGGTASHFLHHWQYDLSRTGGANDEQYSVSPNDLDNPFGTARGQVMAWKTVRNLRNMRGFLP